MYASGSVVSHPPNGTRPGTSAKNDSAMAESSHGRASLDGLRRSVVRGYYRGVMNDLETGDRAVNRPTDSGLLRLEAGHARLAVDLDHGGRVASWSVGGRELVVGPPAPGDTSIDWGWFLMAPWAGRLAGGRFRDRKSTRLNS